MVENVGGTNSNGQVKNYINLHGKDKKLDLNNLLGLQKTDKNKALFDMVGDKNGVLDAKEVKALQTNILSASGDKTLTKEEAQGKFKNMKNAFEAINALAEQQIAYEDNKKYTETIDNKEKVYQKSETPDTRGNNYTIETKENGTKVYTFERDGLIYEAYPDNTGKAINPDGSYVLYKNNVKTEKHTKDEKDITYYKPNGNVDYILQKGESETIKTYYEDTEEDPSITKVTKTTNQNGHQIETNYNSSENYEKNRPYEQVVDGQNETAKTVTTFTYDVNGNVKAETKNSAGEITETKYTNAEGETIKEEDFKEEAPTETTYTVKKGEGINKIVRNILEQQGIKDISDEDFKKAKAEFLELNADKVKIYNGIHKNLRGNKFFYVDEVVQMPDFSKLNSTSNEEETETVHTNETETLPEDIQKKLAAFKEVYKDQYDISYNQETKLFEVKNKDGKIDQRMTDRENKTTADFMLQYYNDNKDKGLDFNEYNKVIQDHLAEAGITFEKPEEVKKHIENSFNKIDAINKDGILSPEELKKKVEDEITALITILYEQT